jgi:hypothetical protein
MQCHSVLRRAVKFILARSWLQHPFSRISASARLWSSGLQRLAIGQHHHLPINRRAAGLKGFNR